MGAAALSEDGVVDGGIIDPPGVAPVDPVLEAARDFEEEDDDDEGDEDGDEVPLADEADVAEVAEIALAAAEPDLPDDEPPSREADLLITQDNVWGNAVQDARRRDFTVNGLFYDPVAGRVIDHVGGVRDLQKNEIRTIGDPEVRMREDPVRILRAVRFAAKLGLDIEPRTYAAMEGAVEDLPRCSAPRLLEETFRLIRTGHAARCLELLIALDALKLLLPPIDAWLRSHGPDGAKTFLAYAQALDDQVAEGAVYDDSMLLAAILLPLSLAEAGPAVDVGRPMVAQNIETLLMEMLRTARLPRRIAERCRMILSAQRTLAGERRRRGGLGTFRQHPLFEESFKVVRVWVEATGERRAALEAWDAGAAPEPAADAPGPVKRRRRRRRGGGSGSKGPGSPPPAAGGAD
jgi:poly(A) polymerase